MHALTSKVVENHTSISGNAAGTRKLQQIAILAAAVERLDTSTNLLHNFAGKGVLNVPGGVLRYIIFTCAQKLTNSQLNLLQGTKQTRMSANARRDGRPAEHTSRSLLNAAKFG